MQCDQDEPPKHNHRAQIGVKIVGILAKDWSINIQEKVQAYSETFNDQLEEYTPLFKEFDKMEKILLLSPERLNMYEDLLKFKRVLDQIQEEKTVI